MAKKKDRKKSSASVEPVVIDTQTLDAKTKDEVHTIIVDSNHSAHRILEIANETKKIGEETTKRLDDQGEQINRIDRDTQELDYQVKKNKRAVKGINSIWWAIVHFFTPKCLKPQKPKFDDDVLDEEDKERNEHRSTASSDSFSENAATLTILYDERTKRVADDTSKVLCEANDAVHDIEDLATGMNKKLRTQNQKLDKIVKETDSVNSNLKKTSKYALSYLGQSV